MHIILMELKHLNLPLKKVIPTFLIFLILIWLHPFAFSEGPDGSGSSYTTNVTNNGTTVEITITETTPDLHYYCENHPGMGSSAEVSHISFGNFILSNGNETNILNDIESIKFDNKTIDLFGDNGGQVFTNTDSVDNFNGSWWEDYLVYQQVVQ